MNILTRTARVANFTVAMEEFFQYQLEYVGRSSKGKMVPFQVYIYVMDGTA